MSRYRVKERQVKEDAARKAFEAKKVDIIKALAVAIAAKKPAALIDLVLNVVNSNQSDRALAKKYLGAPTTTDQVLRHLAFLVLHDELDTWDAHSRFQALVKKAIGLELAPILKAAPETKTVKPGKGTRGVCKVCGCTETTTCWTKGQPCGWVDRTGTLCTACSAKAPAKAAKTTKGKNR